MEMTTMLLFYAAFIVILYFFFILPNKKKQKALKQFITDLKNNVKLKINRAAISMEASMLLANDVAED